MGEKKISRRDFLKGITGIAAGAAVTVALPKVAKADSIAAKLSEMLNEREGIAYVDSLGREVIIPEKIISLIPSGIYAQTILIMLCPDKLAALARPVSEEDISDYERSGLEYLIGLPKTGEMFPLPGYSEINTDAIKRQGTDVILDIGAPKEGQIEKFDLVEDETGKVTLFINATVGNLGNAFRELGSLLDCEERASELAEYVDGIYEEIGEFSKNVSEEIRVYYAAGSHGTDRRREYSFQNEVIRMLGFIPVEVPAGYDERQIDTSLIPEIEADYIIFGSWQCYDNIVNMEGEDYEIWQEADVIKRGAFAVAPGLFQSWMGTALVQMIGALWLGNIISSDVYAYDVVERTRAFYNLFFSYELSNDVVMYLLGIENSELVEKEYE